MHWNTYPLYINQNWGFITDFSQYSIKQKMVIRKLTSVWSCLRFFVAIFSVFFSLLASCLTSLALHFGTYTPTCNSAAKHRLYIEFEIACTGWYERATSQCITKLKGKNTCGRFVFISNRSDAGKPFQTAPAHRLCILEGWYVFNRAPLQPLEICLFLAFAHNIDHRVTKTIAPLTFKKFTRCVSTVFLWHNI